MNPNWAELYPINSKGGPVGLLPPRTACKLFYDGLYILEKADENPKHLQDRIPECVHKMYKKKQWRKQFIEGCRRVVCRIAKGRSLTANCIAEEVFIHVILRDTFELGWRRIMHHIQIDEDNPIIPETDKDRDFARIARLGASDDVGYLYKDADTSTKSKKPVAPGKEKLMDLKDWFRAYSQTERDMKDHLFTLRSDGEIRAVWAPDEDEGHRQPVLEEEEARVSEPPVASCTTVIIPPTVDYSLFPTLDYVLAPAQEVM